MLSMWFENQILQECFTSFGEVKPALDKSDAKARLSTAPFVRAIISTTAVHLVSNLGFDFIKVQPFETLLKIWGLAHYTAVGSLGFITMFLRFESSYRESERHRPGDDWDRAS
jgi:hypothetical protein